jgi:signal transduction histidine kinase
MGYTDFLLEDKTLNVSQKRDIDRIFANSQHLLRLIDEFLDLTRIESGIIKLEKEMTDIASVVREVVGIFKLEADKKKIQFVNHVGPTLPLVLIDRSRIMQVLDNLVNNALKFTNEGGKITLTAEQQKDTLEISVADTGIGIPLQYLDRIFERFERVPNVSRPDVGGSGLGLTICRNILHLHQSKIWVESEEGKGSKFTFSLPVYKQSTVGSPQSTVDSPRSTV